MTLLAGQPPQVLLSICVPIRFPAKSSSQTWYRSLDGLDQSTSWVPSALKSPMPTADHDPEQPSAAPHFTERSTVELTVPLPFASHSCTTPVPVLCHST